MARKPIKEPKTRSEAFLTSQRPLQIEDLTKQEQKKAFKAVSEHTMRTRENLAKLAEHVNHPNKEVRVKANRAQLALDTGAVNKPYNHEEAIQQHVEGVEQAARIRRPGEAIRGGGFYISHADPIHAAVEGHDLTPELGYEATAKLSVRNKPGNEKKSLAALMDAHEKGAVTFTPELVTSINSVSKQPVPQEHVGKTIPFSQVTPENLAAMVHPDVRDLAQHSSTNVDFPSIAKGGMRTNNIAPAHAVLQTRQGNDPYSNPKLKSYALSHAEAPRAGSPEAEEYNMRMAHISDAVTGQIGRGQQAFDFYGLQDNNQGHLSNVAPTPIDLHHKRIAYNQPSGAPYAAVGDISLTAKGDIARGDKKITGEGIEHAVLQNSVHEAAKRIQQKYDLPFTVPSRVVNEGAWAATREKTGDDTNPLKKEVDAAHSEALKEHERKKANLSKQLDLFA
jgi:hypothetical protein